MTWHLHFCWSANVLPNLQCLHLKNEARDGGKEVVSGGFWWSFEVSK